jgi:hypothetical protein
MRDRESTGFRRLTLLSSIAVELDHEDRHPTARASPVTWQRSSRDRRDPHVNRGLACERLVSPVNVRIAREAGDPLAGVADSHLVREKLG